MPETCRVLWQNKFWIFDESTRSWLFYTKFITMHGHLNIKYTTLTLLKCVVGTKIGLHYEYAHAQHQVSSQSRVWLEYSHCALLRQSSAVHLDWNRLNKKYLAVIALILGQIWWSNINDRQQNYLLKDKHNSKCFGFTILSNLQAVLQN